MSQGTGSDIKISKTQIRKAVKQGGSLWGSLISLRGKLLPMAMPIVKKAAAPLVTGALSGLASLGVDKIFRKGQRGGFLIPMDKIAQLVAYKHLLNTGQKTDTLKALQTGNGLVIRPTKTQNGGFLGTLLASIEVPLLLNVMTRKGLQADRTGSANIQHLFMFPIQLMATECIIRTPTCRHPSLEHGKTRLVQEVKEKKKKKGLLLGKNSPFNSIPILGTIL